ncbi:hypothetical protein AALP_AAs71225U000100 [Arabis alpina]|uniref:Uncharacterized protein n=1 Tax=Arabis alpina TaxID=50452 RepID=A0A087FYA1_ARAAL|nr:hypothetical protein AALP_AAs71225U000100 [Arabis alpina]
MLFSSIKFLWFNSGDFGYLIKCYGEESEEGLQFAVASQISTNHESLWWF